MKNLRYIAFIPAMILVSIMLMFLIELLSDWIPFLADLRPPFDGWASRVPFLGYIGLLIYSAIAHIIISVSSISVSKYIFPNEPSKKNVGVMILVYIVFILITLSFTYLYVNGIIKELIEGAPPSFLDELRKSSGLNDFMLGFVSHLVGILLGTVIGSYIMYSDV